MQKMGPGGAVEKKNNVLPLWGNEKTMNLNNMILTNILSSHYFKVNLYQLKTYHEVIDEIFYHVSHLEPWEKGSRKTSGQTGMCGGVRGVGAGGIVSTAFCILYKLFTLKLTRKQLVGMLLHRDSPYIRGLGFMYIRYTQPPPDLWEWFEPYLDDDEELDVKAGGGQMMSIGEILRHMLSKLEWYATLFPRIPVPIQKDLERKLSTLQPLAKAQQNYEEVEENYEEAEVEEEHVEDYGKKKEELPWAGSSTSSRPKDREETKSRNDRVEKREPREHYRRSRSPSHNRHHRHHRSRSRTKSNSEREEQSASRERRYHHSERHHSRHHSYRSRRHSPGRDVRHHRSHH